MTNELISVVIPARNAGRFISRTLASACAQTHSQIEIIVVDDGSTDDTAAIVQQFAARDQRIRSIRTDHKGVSAARNQAIAAARGRYIAPLDADDLWHPDKLARQVDVLRNARSDVGVVYCWSAGIDERDRIVLPVWNNSRASGDVLHDIVVSGILSNGSTPLIRREAIEMAGGYDENLRFCEDWKFYTALAGVCHFAVIPECLTGYRLHDESASMNLLPMEKSIEEVTNWIRRKWPHLPDEIFSMRAYTVNTYLAFLAIRACDYRRAIRFLAAALKTKPVAIVDPSFLQFIALVFVHMIGIRRYYWRIWSAPRPFPQSSQAAAN